MKKKNLGALLRLIYFNFVEYDFSHLINGVAIDVNISTLFIESFYDLKFGKVGAIAYSYSFTVSNFG